MKIAVTGRTRRAAIAMFFGAWVGFSMAFGLAALFVFFHFLGADFGVKFTREVIIDLSFRIGSLMAICAIASGSIGALTYTYIGRVRAWQTFGVVLILIGIAMAALFVSILHPGIGTFMYAVVALITLISVFLGFMFFTQASRFAIPIK